MRPRYRTRRLIVVWDMSSSAAMVLRESPVRSIHASKSRPLTGVTLYGGVDGVVIRHGVGVIDRGRRLWPSFFYGFKVPFCPIHQELQRTFVSSITQHVLNNSAEGSLKTLGILP